MEHINLEEFCNGGFTEQVNREMQRVMDNISDPNTDAKTVRKITVTIAYKPNEQRNFIATGVQAKSTLAPQLGAVTAFSVGKNLKTGEVEAYEVGKQIPGQMSIRDVAEATDGEDSRPDSEEMVQVVDQSTGEIYKTLSSDVINFRTFRQA